MVKTYRRGLFAVKDGAADAASPCGRAPAHSRPTSESNRRRRAWLEVPGESSLPCSAPPSDGRYELKRGMNRASGGSSSDLTSTVGDGEILHDFANPARLATRLR